MKLIQYIIIINFLFATTYDIGETMSIEDQNLEFDFCYGQYPSETFKFADLNGSLNGGDYKITLVRMNATWWGPCQSTIGVFDNLILSWQDNPNVAFVNEVNDFGQPYSCEQWGELGIPGIPFILDTPGYAVWDMLNYMSGFTSYAILDHTMTVRWKDCEINLANSYIEQYLEEYLMIDPNGDIDDDGFANNIDNCVENWNPEQSDIDNDSIGDACDDCTSFQGNINNDELVNILDVVELVNTVLSGYTNYDNTSLSTCAFENADTNYDMIINVLDIISTINIILDEITSSSQCIINN